MSQTVFGILADELGLASSATLEQGPLKPELRHRVWESPAGDYARVQDERIAVASRGGSVASIASAAT